MKEVRKYTVKAHVRDYGAIGAFRDVQIELPLQANDQPSVLNDRAIVALSGAGYEVHHINDVSESVNQ